MLKDVEIRTLCVDFLPRSMGIASQLAMLRHIRSCEANLLVEFTTIPLWRRKKTFYLPKPQAHLSINLSQSSDLETQLLINLDFNEIKLKAISLFYYL